MKRTLIAEVTGSRKRENGLVVPCIYHRHSPLHQVAKTLKNELCNGGKLYAQMRIEVPDTPVTKSLFLRMNLMVYLLVDLKIVLALHPKGGEI